MRPNWAICMKSGQKALELGGEILSSGQTATLESTQSTSLSHSGRAVKLPGCQVTEQSDFVGLD